jgi:hypothetical protein
VSGRDVDVQRLDPMRLPAIQKLIRQKVPLEKIIISKAYLRALEQHCAIAVPIFDPNIALFLAIGRSLAAKNVTVQQPPNDAELLAAVSKITIRAKRYFK